MRLSRIELIEELWRLQQTIPLDGVPDYPFFAETFKQKSASILAKTALEDEEYARFALDRMLASPANEFDDLLPAT